MRILRNKNKLLSIFMVLAISLAMLGIDACFAYAGSNSIEVSFTSPGSRQVFEPGSVVEISGTARGIPEVSVTVRSETDILVFAAQPQVDEGVFSTGFTLDADAPDGEYTISLGALGLSKLKKRIFIVDNTNVEVELEKPSPGAKFKAGEIVEIAGTAENIDRIGICVRNSENGRVYVGQPLVRDNSFISGFTLSQDAIGGEYTIYITGARMTAAKTSSFSVSSSGDPGPDPGPGDKILFIEGEGVSNPVSYSREELEKMKQTESVLSVTSDRPEDLDMAVQGVPLKNLLNNARIDWDDAELITFKARDGFTVEFTVDELFEQNRYIFPSKKTVGPIIALLRAEGSSDYDDMDDTDTPVMVYGQRAKTEQTLLWFPKKLQNIDVSTDRPDEWDTPAAVIVTPDSGKKVATEGGEVPSGSLVYLKHSSAIPKIYYTSDGSKPDMDSDIFNLHGCGPEQGIEEPVEITEKTVIKAIAVGRGRYDSDVVSFTFTIGEGTPAPGPTPVEQTINEENIESELYSLEDGRSGVRMTLQPGTLSDIESGVQGSRLVVNSSDDVDEVIIEVPADVMQKAGEKDMSLGVDSLIGSYTLPLSRLNLDEAAAGLGVEPEELRLNITISRAGEEVKNELLAQLGEGEQMLADPITFIVELTAPDGKKIEQKFFGGTYVERSLVLNTPLNTRQSVGAVWDETEEAFLPVPTLFEIRDGKEYAIILSRSNSLYTVLQSDRTFTDIEGHWAQEDIELLSSKMLISGKSETAYEPYSSITRAEFATMLVRALGLEEGVLEEGQFKDVDGTEWYAGSVATAVSENIITGYEGQLFKPDNNITRTEIAVMMVRAARVAGIEPTLSAEAQEEQLAGFADYQTIPSWAQADVAVVARAGIINGMPDGSFSSQTNADRAQSAVILKRFLIYINFMEV